MTTHRRINLIWIASAIFLPMCLSAYAGNGKGKGGNGGSGGAPPPEETIFIDLPIQVVVGGESVVQRIIHGFAPDGSGKKALMPFEYGGQTISVKGAPSSRVYGGDPVLDRWWIAPLEISVGGSREIFAIHPGYGVTIQLTDLSGSIDALVDSAACTAWSNDGADSFFSFYVVVDASSWNVELCRARVTAAELETQWLTGTWQPLTLSDPRLDVIEHTVGSKAHRYAATWSPSGNDVLVQQRVNPGVAPYYSKLEVLQLDSMGATRSTYTLWNEADGEPGLDGTAPSWSPSGLFVTFSDAFNLYVAPFDGSSPPTIAAAGRAGKVRYGNSTIWSPIGDKIAASAAVQKNFFDTPRTATIIVNPFTGTAYTFQDPGGGVHGWVSNLPGSNYVP